MHGNKNIINIKKTNTINYIQIMLTIILYFVSCLYIPTILHSYEHFSVKAFRNFFMLFIHMCSVWRISLNQHQQIVLSSPNTDMFCTVMELSRRNTLRLPWEHH